MFKHQSVKKKGTQNLVEKHFEETLSNFKSGSIQMTTKELFFVKSKKLNELTKIPKENESFRIITQRAINSFDFILAVLHEEKVDELIVAFYRTGKKILQEIHDLQESKHINTVYFLVNDGMPKLNPDAFNLLKSFESETWNIRLLNNHTKIILMKTNKNNYYVIEGSGNLSINARIEQYVFDNNEKLYNFHKNWITTS